MFVYEWRLVMETGVSLDSYKIFCTVVRTGNMSAAAKELFISQPAVSMAMKQVGQPSACKDN